MTPRLPIRSKLIAGLVLVLTISAVLTTSTLFGLYSYRDTIRAFKSKSDELPKGKDVWAAIAQLDEPDAVAKFRSTIPAASDLAGRIALVDRTLKEYRRHVEKTLRQGRDPDSGRAEFTLLDQIESKLDELRLLPPACYWGEDDGWAIDLDFAMRDWFTANRMQFRRIVAEMRSLVATLPEPTSNDMKALAEDASVSYTTVLWIAWSMGLLVFVLLIVLARQSYEWIFLPISQLHRSVCRVGRGDLSHRIALATGDEMQEFAEAFNDMTAQLEATHHNLERQVEERSRQLVRSEHLASVGFLAAGVAHEINNPLASISLGAEALQRRLRPIVPAGAAGADDLWRCLGMIQCEAFRCKGITEKLLDFSRLGDQVRQRCVLADIVADVIDVIQHMGRYREKEIVLAGSANVVAQVNPQEIKQVVLNLAVNGLDAMDAGGTLTIDVRDDGTHATVVFADEGCGMTPDDLNKIFEPFFTRSRTGKGTGLGLSITHRIVTAHGGQIEATSDGPGRGSTFIVRLPVARPVTEDQTHEQCAA